MKRKSQVKKFIEDNYSMINSLMTKEEIRYFCYDVCKIILKGIDELIEIENRKNNYIKENYEETTKTRQVDKINKNIPVIFRGISINSKRIYYGYYGVIGTENNSHHYIIQNCAITKLFEQEEDNMYFNDVEIDKDSVEQFIGFDENEKPIWRKIELVYNYFDYLKGE